MRFLADESCDRRVVVALRAAGFDVVSIAETAAGMPDPGVLEQAAREQRILLTEDRDFGRLVFATRAPGPSPGVLYIRCPEAARSSLPKWIVATVLRIGKSMSGHFCTWSPGKLRLR